MRGVRVDAQPGGRLGNGRIYLRRHHSQAHIASGQGEAVGCVITPSPGRWES